MTTALDKFSHYHPIWEVDRDEDLTNFNKDDPKLSEYETKIKHYEELEVEINGLPEYYDVGPIALYTGESVIWQALGWFLCRLCSIGITLSGVCLSVCLSVR